MTPTPDDLEALQSQLGRPARGVICIETRCPIGHPQVIKVYPLLREEARVVPFPTLFWLTCPRLIRQISAFEHQGLIATLEKKLQNDPDFKAAYHQNHQSYRSERWETLCEEDQRWVKTKGWLSDFKDRGIGGIADWDRIKCLHLQFAHHLARENVLGQWLKAHFELSECTR